MSIYLCAHGFSLFISCTILIVKADLLLLVIRACNRLAQLLPLSAMLVEEDFFATLFLFLLADVEDIC